MLLDRFVFVHIMKCGGTTFNRIIRNLFEDKGLVYKDKMFRKDRYDEIILLTDKSEKYIHERFNPEKHRYVIGHFTVNKYKHLGWPQITFLRDPIERVLSYYSVWFYNKNGPDWPIEKFVRKMPNYMYFMTKGNLNDFAFVGICERYKESLQIFEKMFKIKIPDKSVWYNKTSKKRKFKITGKQRQFIENHNKKDRKLYNQALKRFDQQVERWLK